MQKAAKLRVEMAACSTEYKCGEASAAITREGEGPYPPGPKFARSIGGSIVGSKFYKFEGPIPIAAECARGRNRSLRDGCH
jgi:hypothetical protein